MKAGRLFTRVELEPGGTRVAVAGLADAAGIDQPLVGAEIERRVVARLGATDFLAFFFRGGAGKVERDVRVADQGDPGGLRVEAGIGLLGGEHVLPNRVAWGGMEEADPLPFTGRLELAQRRQAALGDVFPRPGDRLGGSLGESGDVEGAKHSEVVVADEADGAALAHQVRALVGLGAVAEHVAEAPDLLDSHVVGRPEDRLEGGQVGVDVADHGYAHRAASVPG